MDLGLEGRAALVTGASSGIGRASAVALAREGARVALVARHREPLRDVAAGIVAEGLADPLVIPADITLPADVDRTVDATMTAFGAVEILVAAAGARLPSGLSASEDEWRAAMALNFDAQRRLAQCVLPHMIDRDWGRIVFITGKSEPQVAAGTFAAKSALHAFAKGLSREMGRHHITVNCLAPGKILTEQMRRHYDEEARMRQVEQIPVGRYGQPEDVGRVAAFLASPASDFLSGTVIPVDGGMRWYQL